LEIRHVDELGEGARKEISDIFVGGFFKWLRYFSKEPEKLSRALAHMFRLEAFYAAVEDGEILGIAACTDGKTPSVHIQTGELRHHLGFIMGSFAGLQLKRELEHHPYPFPLEPGTGSVEFVATNPNHLGRGVASAILRHIFSDTPYRAYVLEVADTNTPAVRLYEKLGSPLSEEIDGVTEPLSRITRATSEDRLHSRFPRHQANDSRCLEIIERVKNDRFGDESAHDCNLHSALIARADEPRPPRRRKVEDILVATVGDVVHAERRREC
jgi:ribosomal protein S18 acetylase RimI-like enzyme